MANHHHITRGFTMIEISVCIAIMALLLLVGIYNLSTSRDRAWRHRCRGNLQTLYEAVRMYCNDHSLPFGAVVTITNLYPTYYRHPVPGNCPATDAAYQSVFTNGVPPVCSTPGHTWTPADGLSSF